MVNEWDRARAAKRGGGAIHLPLDGLAAENQYSREPSHDLTAEKIYEQSWALAVLDQVRSRLQTEYAVDRKAERFRQLEPFLPGEKGELSYVQAARLLGVAEAAVKSEVHRLKKRYRQLLRAEIAQTVSTASEIDDEVRHLIDVVSG